MFSKQFRDPGVSADRVKECADRGRAGTSKDLVIQGEVLHYGLSEPGLQTVRRAHKEHAVAVIHNEYSMLYRRPEVELLPLYQELGIGFLAATINAASRVEKSGFRASVPRFAPSTFAENMALAHLPVALADDNPGPGRGHAEVRS